MKRINKKFSKKGFVSEKEKKFFDLFHKVHDTEMCDYMLLSKNLAGIRIRGLLDNKSVIICNLTDRDGKIGLPIIDINNDRFEESDCLIILKNETHKLCDRFLYNIKYDRKSKSYSLETHGEYFEKLSIKR